MKRIVEDEIFTNKHALPWVGQDPRQGYHGRLA